MSFGEYEVKNKPLFASMKRAKSALMKEHVPSCDIEEFFSYLENKYGENVKYIEYITFYDYVFDAEKFHYNIAYIYTEPSLMMRNLLFDEREDITQNTGWYPMVSGSRANFTIFKFDNTYKYWNIMKHKPPYVHLGRPLSIQNVATDISSTALLLRCEKGNILLDTGFGVDEVVIDKVNFIFLSHFHRDHSGGIYRFLEKKEVPVILSGITLEYLLNLNGIEKENKKRLARNAVLIESIMNLSYIKTTMEFFDSYHCPGSYGFKYKFYKHTLIFPGDMCLENGFYDYSKEFNQLVTDSQAEKISVITDCALLPRGDFSITDEDFEGIAENIKSSVKTSMFLSRSAELLFSVYIRLFKTSIDENKKWIFIVNEELYNLLKNVLRTWLLPEYKGDLYIEHVIRRSHINYAETQRLYTISNVEQFVGYKEQKLIFLLTLDDLDKIKDIIDDENIEMYITGPAALNKNLDEMLSDFKFLNVKKLISPDWSFHSDKKMLTNFINETSGKNIEHILFHAFPKVVKKFVREFPLEIQKKLLVISKEETIL